MDLMIDIETLGTQRRSLILSIGWVLFDPRAGDSFEELLQRTQQRVVDMRWYQGKNFVIDVGTFDWWLCNHPEEFVDLCRRPDKVSLPSALLDLYDACQGDVQCVWANSPSFDLEMLKYAFGQTDVATPWKFFEERDVRTTLDLAKVDKRSAALIPAGLRPHRADHDAAWQAWLVQHAYQRFAAGVVHE